MIALALTIALLVQSPAPEPTVTLIFRDRTQTITLSEAKALYKTVDPVKDQALHVALTLALGTAPVKPCSITWQQHVAEVRSWWAAPERVPPCELR